MEVLPFSLASLLAAGFLTLLGFVLLLNIFGLPANWIVVALVAIWKAVHPATEQMGLTFWLMLLGLAVLGEILEFALQIVKAKRYGSSSAGTFAGMLGAIAGAILLAPLFFGLGALLGALAGAWLGCLCMELLRGRPLGEALNAAMGAMLGRFLGTVCKCGAGGGMIALTARYIWPHPGGIDPTAVPEKIGQMACHLLALGC
ncbi:MAG: DUF456 domain-containing protein [Desulfovibrio sp.]|nr:DUF456 domain-containing protein [Desulfovibrio sp.]